MLRMNWSKNRTLTFPEDDSPAPFRRVNSQSLNKFIKDTELVTLLGDSRAAAGSFFLVKILISFSGKLLFPGLPFEDYLIN